MVRWIAHGKPTFSRMLDAWNFTFILGGEMRQTLTLCLAISSYLIPRDQSCPYRMASSTHKIKAQSNTWWAVSRKWSMNKHRQPQTTTLVLTVSGHSPDLSTWATSFNVLRKPEELELSTIYQDPETQRAWPLDKIIATGTLWLKFKSGSDDNACAILAW